MIYLIDSDTISYLFDQTSPFHQVVFNRFTNLGEDDQVYLSLITFYEMKYSLANIQSDPVAYRRIEDTIGSLQDHIPILSLTEKGADIFGNLKAAYRKQTGMSAKAAARHNIDLILASAAIEASAVLVSNDQIYPALHQIEPSLKLENWTTENPSA